MQKPITSVLLLSFTLIVGVRSSAAQTTAPSTYNAYTGTDIKAIPPAPALGAANSVITDPTFGSRVLRVTDANTKGGESFISTDSGFSRAWNSNSTAIKLTGPAGDGYWLEFNPSTFQVGTVPHPLSFGATWEWSAVQPNIIYYLSGSSIETYNTTTGASTPLASTPTGEPVMYMAAVIGLDNWVCAAAGAGGQDTYTKIFCVKPSSPSTWKFIDVANVTINGVAQSSPNWPTSAAGKTIGIHDISGGTGANWLEVTFHQQSWGGDGGAVLNLSTNTWSLVTGADPYWSGHVSMGNGKYENAAGSVNGDDSRGTVLRDPDNLMNSAEYVFVMQPFAPWNGWCDADHSSWLNSVTNPNAPILDSRYSVSTGCPFAWSDEIIASAVDGSNTVWRFAHNFNGGSQCYYAQAFAQISNDGNWALFSSYWGGSLGPDTSFGCATRIDTFIVDLKDATGPSNTPPASQSISFAPLSNVVVGVAPVAIAATASSGLSVSLSSTTAPVCSISGAVAVIIGAGTCSITASQPGNSTYAAATPVTRSFLVSAGPPGIVSLSPNAGAGTSATFKAVFSDPNGAADLNELLVQINTSQSSGNACYAYYQPQTNLMYLYNAGAWMTPGLTPGAAGTVSSSECTLNGGASSVTTAGNNLTLSVALTFSNALTGATNVYLYAAGLSGKNSGWVKEGTWTPNPIAAPPSIVSLSPNAGTGTSQTFKAVYSDPKGASDLNELLLQVNTRQSSANACYVYYQPQTNLLYLYNAGTWMTPGLTPGAAGTVSNSQCTLNGGASSVTMAGNNLTLSVALTFSNTFVGATNVYLYAGGLSGQNSGWVNEGTWTP
jgi:hypothetical protein